jgi:hypothetical protein
MKILLNINLILLALSLVFNPPTVIAKSTKSHTIGFVNLPRSSSGCSYWIADNNRRKSNNILITYNQSGEDKATAKIDGREIKLKRDSQISEGNYTTVIYKGSDSQIEIKDYFHSSTVRVPRSITFIHNNWQKTVKASYECKD